jgi:hypothetical protein
MLWERQHFSPMQFGDQFHRQRPICFHETRFARPIPCMEQDLSAGREDLFNTRGGIPATQVIAPGRLFPGHDACLRGSTMIHVSVGAWILKAVKWDKRGNLASEES